MFKCIMVALDGSPTSDAGLKHAVQLASDQHAELVGVHVVDDAAIRINLEDGYLPATYVRKLKESLHQRSSVVLAKAQGVAKAAGVEMKALRVESHARTIARAILAEARKAKADLIVIGTHGRRGISRMLMGSDAEAVVREATVPVLLVRSPEGEKPRRTTTAGKAAGSSARRHAEKDIITPAPIA
jgi:nucleotide-binding universal stress UspA family protein